MLCFSGRIASRLLWLAATATLILGCDDDWSLPDFEVPARDDSPIQTDRVEYTLHPELDNYVEGGLVALARYTNDMASAVYYSRCTDDSAGPIFDVWRASPDYGEHVVGVAWVCLGGIEPGKVLPGATLEVEVPLGSSISGGEPPITMRERTGLFRVRFELFARYPTADSRVLMAAEQRQSNVFEIHPPD